MEVMGNENLNKTKDFRSKSFRNIKQSLGKLLGRRSITITEYDPTYKVSYLGNVLTGWAKGDTCTEKPLNTLWKNYVSNSKGDVQMKLIVTQSGLKGITKQHGLTEYWSHRITYCCAPKEYPKIFCWVYRHEGRKLKQELRCHAVICSKESVARLIANQLQCRLQQALIEFKRDKLSRQNARLSLANSVYDNPSLPRRKILLSTGMNNYRPPLERSKSAPRLMSIEECIEEEEEEEEEEFKKNVKPKLHRNLTYSKRGNRLGGLLNNNNSKEKSSSHTEEEKEEDIPLVEEDPSGITEEIVKDFEYYKYDEKSNLEEVIDKCEEFIQAHHSWSGENSGGDFNDIIMLYDARNEEDEVEEEEDDKCLNNFYNSDCIVIECYENDRKDLIIRSNSLDEDSATSLQSISSSESDTASDSSSPRIINNDIKIAFNKKNYDLNSLWEEGSDESGYVESILTQDTTDDKIRDSPHHHLIKTCILSSNAHCLQV